mmetsp:Transcript_27604/g.53432  ORF Transcript_27604/g.53432 Transcript_27604/m.53432 type:complete len:405 (+) Transcript_27604:84-1298(+)
MSSSENDGMTPEEREQWLRDRGVQIETSSDRQKLESLLLNNEQGRPMSIVEQISCLSLDTCIHNEGIKFVYLPHDTSKKIATILLPRRLVEVLGPAGDIIPTYVKSFFADGKSIDEGLFRDQVAKQNLVGGDLDKFAAASKARKGEDTKDIEGNKSSPSSTLTSSALANATNSGSVETFPLVRPSSTNKFQGVYIYLDEVGLLKNLPLNPRASQLAQRCGYHPAPNFYGDVFVGRVASQSISKGFLHNIDLEKEDVMDTTKEWMVRAPQENVAWQQSLNEITGKKGELQPSLAGTEGVAVTVEKGSDGASCSYSWIQNEDEVELTIPLLKNDEEGMKVKKNLVKVNFLHQQVSVKYDNKSFLDLHLYSKVDVDGCTWTIDKKNLIVTCEKVETGGVWPRLELSA